MKFHVHLKKTKVIALFEVIALLLFFAACDKTSKRAHIDFSTSNTVYKFEAVERNPVQVQVYPVDGAIKSPTAVVFPFRVTQSMAPREAIPASVAITRAVWNSWLREQVFPALEFEEDVTTYTRSQAINIARSKGADLAIVGEIPYVMAGGTQGHTQLSVHVEVYDVNSGTLIWSISHGGMMENKPTQDYIFFQQRSKLPPDPLYNVTVAVASDIGKVMAEWSNPQDEPGTPDATGNGTEAVEAPPKRKVPKVEGMPTPNQDSPSF